MQLTVTTILYGLPTGQRTFQTRLTLPTETVTVQELIAYKIRQEIAEYTAKQRPCLSGEYLPPEVLLRALAAGGYRPGAVAAEIARAQQAFAARAFMIIIDNRRVTDAEEVLALHPETRVEFIKILPLVGG